MHQGDVGGAEAELGESAWQDLAAVAEVHLDSAVRIEQGRRRGTVRGSAEGSKGAVSRSTHGSPGALRR
jgi:hypothetical protein